MELILLQRIDNLGELGDVVKVKAGYGRNFLLPQGKATVANEANRAKFETIRAELEAKADAEKAAAKQRAESLATTAIEVAARVQSDDQLYGSISTYDIVSALAEAGVEVERAEVRMPDGPLRQLGEHSISLHFHSEVDVPVMVTVIAEES